jgi:putative transposase
MNVGTMEIGRPRVRNLDERFISKVLPMFKRQTEAVRALIPELYLHGLASGYFALALSELLEKGAPLFGIVLTAAQREMAGRIRAVEEHGH